MRQGHVASKVLSYICTSVHAYVRTYIQTSGAHNRPRAQHSHAQSNMSLPGPCRQILGETGLIARRPPLLPTLLAIERVQRPELDDASVYWRSCCAYHFGLCWHRQCRHPRPDPEGWITRPYCDIGQMQQGIGQIGCYVS